MAETEGKLCETRVRYIHHKAGPDVAIPHNKAYSHVHKLELNTAPTDTIIMEKLEDSVVTFLRILHINYRRVTPLFLREYSNVERLEVGCSLSIYWLFRQLHHFPKLRTIRFGMKMFVPKDEEANPCQATREHNSVERVEINYDPHQYIKLAPIEKSSVEMQLHQVLDQTQFYFPNLKFCDINVPKSMDIILDKFTKLFPEMCRAGEKRTSDALVSFKCNLVSYKRKHEEISYEGNRASSSSSRDIPLTDQPNLLQPRDVSTYSFMKHKIEAVVEDDPEPEIVVLGTSPIVDLEGNGEPSNFVNSARISSDSNDTVYFDKRQRRRGSSPSLLSNSSKNDY